jgi:hypothetical protein
MTPGNDPENFTHNNNHGESLQAHKFDISWRWVISGLCRDVNEILHLVGW